MTQENMSDLRANTRIGFCEAYGKAWTFDPNSPDSVANHYQGAVPLEAVRDLFAFTATSSPLYVNLAEGAADMPPMFEQVPNRQAVVRSDTGSVMGVFTDGYQIHQYQEWLLERVATLLGDGSGSSAAAVEDGLAIGSAGLLRGGAQAWVAIELGDNFHTPEGETFRPRLTAVTSHDGSLATTYKRMIMRPVCDNTLRAGLSEDGAQIKVKHSKHSGLRIAAAKDALGLLYVMAEDYAAEVKALCEVAVSDAEWSLFLDAHVPLTVPGTGSVGSVGSGVLQMPVLKDGRALTVATNTRDTLTQLWKSDPRVSPWQGTGWGVLQAVNTFEHHYAIVRKVSREERNMANAVNGKWDDLDANTVSTLNRVLVAAR